MDIQLPVLYLAIFLVLLSASSWFVLRQVLRTRKVESKFANLQKKLKQEKGTAEDYYELASIYLDKRMFTQSLGLFQKALKAGNDLESANLALIYNGLGFAYFSQEQHDLAMRQYKEAIKLNPEYVVALNNLALAYERKQLINQALQTYEEALKFEPNNTTAKSRVDSLRKRFIPSS
jgi:tetratricopeptide (TPR) repeat protein